MLAASPLRSLQLDILLEFELGVTGGEEDGVDNTDVDSSRLYTQPEEVMYAYEQLSTVPNAMFTCAASFGNVHGVYAPGNVDLQPIILHNTQKYMQEKVRWDNIELEASHVVSTLDAGSEAMTDGYSLVPHNTIHPFCGSLRLPPSLHASPYHPSFNPFLCSPRLPQLGGDSKPMKFVFHGGSGSSVEDIQYAIEAGVIKMNIDTDTQWAYWDGVRKYEAENHDYLQAQIGNPDGGENG